MRKILYFLVGIFCLNLLNTPLYASIKPGSICKRVGLISIISDTKYTCIKSGNRLIWDKGVRIRQPKPASTFQASPAPSPTPTPSNTFSVELDLPKEEQAPWLQPNLFRDYSIKPINSISELSNRYMDFHYLAWAAFQDAVSVKNNHPIDIAIEVGPNSKECSTNAKRAIQLIQNLYSDANLPRKLHLLFVDTADNDWAKKRTAELTQGSKPGGINEPDLNPSGISTSTGEAILWSSNSCLNLDPNSLHAGDIAHGYTHAIQRFQFMSNFSGPLWGGVPRWLFEGGATFSENVTERGGSYFSWSLSAQFHDRTIKEYNLDFYRSFLKYEKATSGNASWGPTEAWPNQRSYDVGSLVCEALIAIKGPDAIINLYSDFASTQDFDTSFKNIFGITWTEAEPYVSEAIYKFVQATY